MKLGKTLHSRIKILYIFKKKNPLTHTSLMCKMCLIQWILYCGILKNLWSKIFSRRTEKLENSGHISCIHARSSHQRWSIKNVFKIFAISTKKHLCWSLLKPGTPMNIVKFFRTPILKNIFAKVYFWHAFLFT